ncbi:MAG TPA: methyltetrahydrofolate cobalamin methyltransferase [Candidatus Latescibacteria bacterium]|nr:methyltetrahydrofolate cobalamin methyltransferase [Candidatus Latescibacterota bacterium]
MLVVGELINASRKKVGEAIARRDADYIKKLARRQAEAGADFVDVNCGTFVEGEAELMGWLVDVVQEMVEKPLCIDTPNPEAMKVGLERHRNGRPMVNSVTEEPGRMDAVLPLILERKAKVVALCMSRAGMPSSAEERVEVARRLIGKLAEAGVPLDDIYVDPVVVPVGTDPQAGRAFLEAVRLIHEEFPEVHIICGLSNVSFGLPLRKLLNRNFLVMAMAMGLDAAILDPTDSGTIADICAVEALLGRDPFCMQYIEAYRGGRLVV